MAPSAIEPSDDFLKAASVPWWQSLRFRWLIAAPLLALPLVWLLQAPMHRFGNAIQATWQLEQALRAARDDDSAAALEKVSEAITIWPTHEQLYMVRARIRHDLGDLRGSLEDYDIAVHLAPTYAEAYLQRATVRRLLGYGRDALEDLDTVIALRPRNEPEPLNRRAYFRALEGVELNAALDDIQRAISLVDEPPAAWLDTRACVFLGLGELENAVRDANDSIRLIEKQRERTLRSESFKTSDLRTQQIWQEQLDETLSILYHHRALIHEAIGEPELAQHDAQQAESLGFRDDIE